MVTISNYALGGAVILAFLTGLYIMYLIMKDEYEKLRKERKGE